MSTSSGWPIAKGDRPGEGIRRYRKLFIELVDVRGNIALGDAVGQLCGDRPWRDHRSADIVGLDLAKTKPPGKSTLAFATQSMPAGCYFFPFGAVPLHDQLRPSFGSPVPAYSADCGYGQSGRVSPFAPRPSSCFGTTPCSTHCSIACVESKPLRPGPPRQWPIPGSMNSRIQSPCSGPIFSSTDS